MDDTEKPSALTKFGRELMEIPCARQSYLYGISGGVCTGLLAFLLTSRPRLASHAAVAGFCCITMAYWTNCRYQYYLLQQHVRASEEAIRESKRLQETEPLSEDDKGFVSV